MNDHLSGKELFIRFTARAFRKLLSIYVFSYFPFGFEIRTWDLIVSVSDHCLSFYFQSLSIISEKLFESPKTENLYYRYLQYSCNQFKINHFFKIFGCRYHR